jgi:hypothetical protein
MLGEADSRTVFSAAIHQRFFAADSRVTRPFKAKSEAAEFHIGEIAALNLLRYANVLLLRANSVLCPAFAAARGAQNAVFANRVVRSGVTT